MSVPNSVICASSENPENPDTIVREYGPLVSALCRRMIVDRDKARDAAQEVWFEVIKSLPGFRGESRLSTWITVVARRTIARWIAGENRYSFRSFKSECRITVSPHIEDFIYEDPEPLDIWTRMNCDMCLTAILNCLEPETRFIFILRSVLKTEYCEISRIMDMEESAVRQRYSRARRKLVNFGKTECALINPSGKCRCGQREYIDKTTLVEEFRKLQKIANHLETWLNAEEVFPGKNYWSGLI